MLCSRWCCLPFRALRGRVCAVDELLVKGSFHPSHLSLSSAHQRQLRWEICHKRPWLRNPVLQDLADGVAGALALLDPNYPNLNEAPSVGQVI